MEKAKAEEKSKTSMTIDLTQPIEKRAEDFLKFLTTGIDSILAAGTELLAREDEAAAKEKFCSASTLLYVADTFCHIFNEVKGAPDFLEKGTKLISKTIHESVMLATSKKDSFQC